MGSRVGGPGVSRGGLVGRSRLVGRGGVVGLGLIVAGLSLVADIGDVARLVVRDGIGHGLDAAVGKGNTVAARGGVAVTVLVGIEVNAGVVVLDVVGKVVGGRGGIGGLLVGRPVVGRGGLVGGLVGRGGVIGDGNGGQGKDDGNLASARTRWVEYL